MDFIFDPSLVLYLPLYELDGASFASRDAYGHLCSVTGTQCRPHGRYFDGTDDYIDLGTSALDITGAITVLVWINPLEQSDPNLIYGRIGGIDTNLHQYMTRITTGTDKFGFYCKSGSDTIDGVAVTYGSWQLVGYTYDGSNVIVYQDAVATAGPTAITTPDSHPTYHSCLGARWHVNNCYYKNLMGEALIYTRALTPLEIQHNYLATKWRYR